MTRKALLLGLCAFVLTAQQRDTRELQRYFEQGERALAEKRYATAAEAYEKLCRLDPGSAEAHAKLGVIYFQMGEFERAIPVLRQALKLKPGLSNAGILLSMSLSEVGRYTEALPGLENGFRHSADPALRRMTGLQLQRAYTGLRQDRKAVEIALELSRLYPDDPEVLYHAGKLFGNFAYLTMRKLADVAPDSVWRHEAAGEAYESQGTYDRAIGEYREVLALSPARPGVHFRLGRALLAQARQANSPPEGLAGAMKEFEQELRLDPTNANAAYELAEMHRKSGQFGSARELFELALKYYPDFQEAHVGLGKALAALEKPDLALPHFQKAISLNSEDEVAWYHAARVYRALGRAAEQKKALAEFQRLRARNPQPMIFAPREVTSQELDSEPKP